MRTANSALIALLATGEYVRTDLWTLTLSGGGVVRWHAGDRSDNIVSSGNAFVRGPNIVRQGISEKCGTDVATLDVEFTATYERDNINGSAFIPFVRKKGLDGAVIKLEKAYAPDFDTLYTQGPTGTVLRFAGRVTSVSSIQGATAKVTVSSWMVLLNTQMPRNCYQAGCIHTLYDSGCGLNSASFSATGTIVGSSGATSSFGSSMSPVVNDYALGRIVFTSGANAGEARTIKSNDGAGNFVLINALPNGVAPGDAFTVYPGCDLTMARCSTRFNNLNNYKGTDFVPLPQTPVGSQSTTTTTKSGK